MAQAPITPDLPLTEAGRQLMANQLAIVQSYLPALRDAAEVTAVHESRKAIRRTVTLFRLLAPYFEPDALAPHRGTLRRVMRRLAPCRDLAVFRQKLAAYNTVADPPLIELAAYWDDAQEAADDRLQGYLQRRRVRKALGRYARFVEKEGSGVPRGNGRHAPLLVRHALPALVFQRVGAVRAYGDILKTASPAQLHQLRIQFKELRYTLDLFAPAMTADVDPFIALTRQMQEHLGHLNDASVALDLLTHARHLPPEAASYRAVQEAELARLTAEFPALYARIDTPSVWTGLAVAMAEL